MATMHEPREDQPAHTPDRDAIRASLEQTRREFHALARSVPRSAWRRKSANPAWTIGELLWHLGFNVGFVADSVERARRGKGFNPPLSPSGWLITLVPRLGALRATPKSVAQRYEASYRRLLGAFDSLRDDQFSLTTTNFGATQTVEALFRSAPEHFAEHAADIRARL